MSPVRRAISSVVGVTLMVIIVVMLASVMTGMVLTFGDELEEPELTNSTNSAEALNPWDDEDALLAPEDPAAGAEDVRYRVIFQIQSSDSDIEGDSLNELRVEVSGVDESMFSGVAESDVETFEVEKTDGTVLDIQNDVETEDNWALQEGGSELEMTLGGSAYTNPEVGDVITVIFGNVDNPSDPGTYDITVTLNQDEADASGTLEIVEG
jgi:hypothetical protein